MSEHGRIGLHFDEFGKARKAVEDWPQCRNPVFFAGQVCMHAGAHLAAAARYVALNPVRALGDEAFIKSLEAETQRSLIPGKRGPKPAPKSELYALSLSP